MAFNYDRVFVVVDHENNIQGIFKKKEWAVDSLPEEKKRHPMEITKLGDWKYGKGTTAWKILEKKVKDSAGIPSL